MARTAAFALLLSLTVLVAPLASAKESGIDNPDSATPVKLYMHLIDFQDFPINTQPPDDKWTQDTTYGLTTSTTSCLPNGTPGADLSQTWHTFYGYSSPSYVEYLQEQSGKPRFHAERGISYDTNLDTSAPFILYWYLSLQGPAPSPDGAPDPDSIPAPVPNVVVKATMRAGDLISVDDRAYNTGEVIAQGQTTPATLFMDQVLPAPAEMTALGQHDGKWLYQAAIPMAIQKGVIPRASGYNIRLDIFMDNPACTSGPDAALMPNMLAIHSSKDFRPRMEFAITNPIRISALHPQFVGDDLVVHVAANAAWGNYDVAEPSAYTPDIGTDGLVIAIEGPSAATSMALVNLVSPTNPHYRHQEDVTLAYVWPYKTDRAEPGVYTITFEAWNDQRTAKAVAVSEFELGRGNDNVATECDEDGCRPATPEDPGDGRDAPGMGPVALLGAVAVLALLRRRGRVGPGSPP